LSAPVRAMLGQGVCANVTHATSGLGRARAQGQTPEASFDTNPARSRLHALPHNSAIRLPTRLHP
jgi:hypothetical protein